MTEIIEIATLSFKYAIGIGIGLGSAFMLIFVLLALIGGIIKGFKGE